MVAAVQSDGGGGCRDGDKCRGRGSLAAGTGERDSGGRHEKRRTRGERRRRGDPAASAGAQEGDFECRGMGTPTAGAGAQEGDSGGKGRGRGTQGEG
ncbi:hypothetical protein E2562_020451 [Oryza meyeriana var. granulata]|uniref:Uncharacterized protein n=1 Tax=Oryza meyeriana var. granulata TaxID=110450 RepID=A0A6G1D5S0_9ORYZ|nr:hypothetical protein E2562_020451 [Oryza meyeriana var. granulata]